jgi:hypothetical protein
VHGEFLNHAAMGVKKDLQFFRKPGDIIGSLLMRYLLMTLFATILAAQEQIIVSNGASITRTGTAAPGSLILIQLIPEVREPFPTVDPAVLGVTIRFHCEIRFEHVPTAIEAIRWIWELHGNAKQLGNESGLRDCILLRHPSRSALPNHIHGFDSWILRLGSQRR